MILVRTGVTDIGRKSVSKWGFLTLGTGLMDARRRGYTIGDGWGCIPPHQPYPKKIAALQPVCRSLVVSKCRWGIGTNRDSGVIAGYRRLLDVPIAKNIYRGRSCVYDTVGHAPLA